MSERLFRSIDNYELSLRQGANGRLSEKAIRERLGNYSRMAVIQEQELLFVKQVLNGFGVSTIIFPMYHAFSRRVSKLKRQYIGGEALVDAVSNEAAKWEMRGLLRQVLIAIASDVYNIVVPDPSGEGKD
jgi:hypothetical protein